MQETLGIDTQETPVEFDVLTVETGEEHPQISRIIARPEGFPTADITDLVNTFPEAMPAFQADLQEAIETEAYEDLEARKARGELDDEEVDDFDGEGYMDAKDDFIESTGPEGPPYGLPGSPYY